MLCDDTLVSSRCYPDAACLALNLPLRRNWPMWGMVRELQLSPIENDE